MTCQTARNRVEVCEGQLAPCMDDGGGIRRAPRLFRENLVEAAIEHEAIVAAAERGDQANRIEDGPVQGRDAFLDGREG
jgi:hypothetical protein